MSTSCFVNVFLRTLAALVLALPHITAQTSPQSGQDANDQIQALRIEGRRLLANEPEQALAKFEAAVRYWQQPLIQDLARGNVVLDSRYVNLCIDLAEVHVKLGRKSEAIAWIEKADQAGRFDGFARFLEQNPSFASLQNESAFQLVLAASRKRQDFWESAALKTPYRENLSDAEKIAGLSKFWSEVKYNFAYPERLTEIDWDQLYLRAIPMVLATKSTGDYYRELKRLCALISDGHTNVNYPDSLKLAGRPPLRTVLIAGRVAITGVYAPARIEPDNGPHFSGPVIVLSSPATYSAAEDFLVAFRSSGRGRIVGELSGGSTGQPLLISLPGGGSARICSKQDLMPSGVKWVGIGIRPDIEVKASWADFRQSRDTVLEEATRLLQ